MGVIWFSVDRQKKFNGLASVCSWNYWRQKVCHKKHIATVSDILLQYFLVQVIKKNGNLEYFCLIYHRLY